MGNFCEQCGTKLQEGAAFCSKCGASVGIKIPGEGAEVYKAVPEFTFPNAVQQAGSVQTVQDKNKKDKKKGKKAVVISIVAAVIVLMLAATAVVLYLRSDGYQCKKNMKLAEESFEAEEYKEALSYYKEALALDDTIVDAYIKSADIYVMEESFENALKILKKGLKKIEDEESIEMLNDKLKEVYLSEADYYEQAIAGSAAADSSSEKMIKVGIINDDPNGSGYRTANDNDMKATFTAENGYDALFTYSNDNDEQITAAQKFIKDGVDYLLLSAAGTAGWDSTLQDAQKAGVKVILFDRVIDADASLYEASIVSNMTKEGQAAVDWLEKQGLREYNIIHLQGVMGTAAQIGRSSPLVDAAASKGWNIVSQQTAEWNAENAQQIVQSVIDSGESFNVIYAENDDMAKGAVAALDNANISHGVGKDVIIMGFDCNQWALQELLDQKWNYDGQCSPFQASYIDSVIKTLENGGTISEKIIIMDEKGFDATTITADDVRNYGI